MYNLDKTLIAKFRKQLSEEILDRRHSISQGGLQDIVAYKEMCAQVSAFEESLRIFNDIVEKLQVETE